MKTYLTEIKAIDPNTGKLSTWAGPRIEANDIIGAEFYLQENYLGYCRIIGYLTAEQDALILNLN